MPFFNGTNIFGAAVQMATADNPRATQVNNFFGLDGTEILDGGARGRFTMVSGILYGQGASGLAFAENLFRSYKDGNLYYLTDSLGQLWSNVRLESFQPEGRIMQDSYSNYLRTYTAKFHHLTDF